jgi:hypothetical protein
MMNSVAVMTKQGVRNLNELGPKKKPGGTKQVPEAIGGPSTKVPEKPPVDEKVGR